MREALLRAYRATRYEVAGIEIRIGRRSRPMDRLLSMHGARTAAFITAYNPFSRLMPPGWNQRMQALLIEAGRRRPILLGQGRWRSWSEEHIVVLGDVRPTRTLARRFRQNAVVIVCRGQPARLVVTS